MSTINDVIRSAEAHKELIRSIATPNLSIPDYSYVGDLVEAQAEAQEAPTARRAVTRILAEIQSFQEQLDSSLDVALQLISLPNFIIHVADVGFYQPNLIVFYGHITGKPTRLVQHLSQLNFVLTSVAREHPEEPRRAIGFHVEE